ncbi:hypothetical protein [Actinomadura keratinilytica]|jgi:hypothetical protein|uniref:Uncharacterized protein n=1 Tax=Actinomadura keratinilytica TaxID=547461 RepID=A0ABP7YXF2_9ACTN
MPDLRGEKDYFNQLAVLGTCLSASRMVVDYTAYGLKAQNPVAVALPAARALLARRPEDVIAREIERTTGWVVWFGRVTGHYWATPRVPHPWARLLESDSPDGLRAAIGQVEMFYGGVAPL